MAAAISVMTLLSGITNKIQFQLPASPAVHTLPPKFTFAFHFARPEAKKSKFNSQYPRPSEPHWAGSKKSDFNPWHPPGVPTASLKVRFKLHFAGLEAKYPISAPGISGGPNRTPKIHVSVPFGGAASKKSDFNSWHRWLSEPHAQK